MYFFVSDDLENFAVEENAKEWFILSKNHWNDWFRFKTLFSLYYCKEGVKEWVGNLKIGYLDGKFVKEEDRYYAPDLPIKFSRLPEHFFSVGQDVDYYTSLNSFHEDERVEILKALRDISYDLNIYEKTIGEEVTRRSLTRDISTSSIKGQFRRLSHGNAQLTSFNFKYTLPNNNRSPLEISVVPKTIPPTNIHVVIGRNGVGKTYLLANLINFVKTESESYGKLEHFVDGSRKTIDKFANLISVSFSAFDSGFNHEKSELINFESIGWKLVKNNSSDELSFNGISSSMLIESLKLIKMSGRINRWKTTISKLNSDPMFKKYDLTILIEHISNEKYIKDIFERLSSGHKIVFLTLTQLIQKVEERSLVVLDEPELHLHPPLLSAFIRALSDLLMTRNAIAIIATHSPVILQEVPKSCVSILNRISRTENILLRRPEVETFGNNVGVLTSTVFNLEVTDSGYHMLLKKLVSENDSVEEVLEILDGQLALEGMSILISLFNQKNNMEIEDA